MNGMICGIVRADHHYVPRKLCGSDNGATILPTIDMASRCIIIKHILWRGKPQTLNRIYHKIYYQHIVGIGQFQVIISFSNWGNLITSSSRQNYHAKGDQYVGCMVTKSENGAFNGSEDNDTIYRKSLPIRNYAYSLDLSVLYAKTIHFQKVTIQPNAVCLNILTIAMITCGKKY